jgi:site-specific DNA-methyltransferase (adenine-specific)
MTTPIQYQALLTQMDAVDYLRRLGPGSVDLIVTDPPYESLEKHRARGTTTRLKHSKSSSNDWFKVFPNSRFRELLQEFYRVLKPNTHLYVFCDQETMFVIKPLAEEVGFKFWKPLVWDKVHFGMGYHYRAQYEFVLFFEKGKRALNDLGVGDVITQKRIKRKDAFPTEKPVEVSEVLVRQSSQPGEVVLDPFMGSGSVGVAACQNGRQFLGNDVDDRSLVEAARALDSFGVHRVPSVG